jgi:hypothetical protein
MGKTRIALLRQSNRLPITRPATLLLKGHSSQPRRKAGSVGIGSLHQIVSSGFEC